MLLKIHIVLLVIFPKNISPNKNSSNHITNLSIKTHSQDLLLNTIGLMVTVEEVQALLKRNHNSKSQFLNQVLFKKEIFLLHNSGDTMIEEIFLSELITKIHFLNLHGKFQLSHLTIIIIFQYFSMEQEKSLILTVHLPFWEHTIFLTREETKYCQ